MKRIEYRKNRKYWESPARYRREKLRIRAVRRVMYGQDS